MKNDIKFSFQFLCLIGFFLLLISCGIILLMPVFVSAEIFDLGSSFEVASSTEEVLEFQSFVPDVPILQSSEYYDLRNSSDFRFSMSSMDSSSELMDFFNTGWSDYASFGHTNHYGAQTFYATSTYIATSVFLRLRINSGASGLVYASLRATDSGKPTGSDIAVGSYESGDITDDWVDGELYEFVFDESVELDEDTLYSVVLYCPIATCSDATGKYLGWFTSTTGYSGDGESSVDGSSWSITDPPNDFMFEVWGYVDEEPPIESSGVLGLFATSTCVYNAPTTTCEYMQLLPFISADSGNLVFGIALVLFLLSFIFFGFIVNSLRIHDRFS